jgi:hypothetical protein
VKLVTLFGKLASILGNEMKLNDKLMVYLVKRWVLGEVCPYSKGLIINQFKASWP